MPLTIGEKLGAFLAFIPGVSIVSSLIKAFVYYRRAKKDAKDLEKMEKTAAKASEAAKKQLVNLESSYLECDQKLWKASIAEMIPGINIIAAIYSAVTLRKLSKVREVNRNPETQKNFLFEKYGVDSFQDEERNKLFTELLIVLDSINITDERNEGIKWKNLKKSVLVPLCFGFVTGRKDVDAVVLLKNFITDNIEEAKERIEKNQNKLKEIEAEIESNKLKPEYPNAEPAFRELMDKMYGKAKREATSAVETSQKVIVKWEKALQQL